MRDIIIRLNHQLENATGYIKGISLRVYYYFRPLPGSRAYLKSSWGLGKSYINKMECETHYIKAARRKKLKLLDINSDEAIGDTSLPNKEKLKQLLSAKIDLLYCNKHFNLERTLKELESVQVQ